VTYKWTVVSFKRFYNTLNTNSFVFFWSINSIVWFLNMRVVCQINLSKGNLGYPLYFNDQFISSLEINHQYKHRVITKEVSYNHQWGFVWFNLNILEVQKNVSVIWYFLLSYIFWHLIFSDIWYFLSSDIFCHLIFSVIWYFLSSDIFCYLIFSLNILEVQKNV
jgi:hypothetical protein